jgi:hypothetical protein
MIKSITDAVHLSTLYVHGGHAFCNLLLCCCLLSAAHSMRLEVRLKVLTARSCLGGRRKRRDSAVQKLLAVCGTTDNGRHHILLDDLLDFVGVIAVMQCRLELRDL